MWDDRYDICVYHSCQEMSKSKRTCGGIWYSSSMIYGGWENGVRFKIVLWYDRTGFDLIGVFICEDEFGYGHDAIDDKGVANRVKCTERLCFLLRDVRHEVRSLLGGRTTAGMKWRGGKELRQGQIGWIGEIVLFISFDDGHSKRKRELEREREREKRNVEKSVFNTSLI